MNSQGLSFSRRVLGAAASRYSIEWPVTLAITVLTVSFHIISSVDLGLSHLGIRIPLAIASVIPLIILMQLANYISISHEKYRTINYILAIFSGGLLRGIFLEWGLEYFEISLLNPFQFRTFASVVISIITATAVSFFWSMVREAQIQIAYLEGETVDLQEALAQVESRAWMDSNERASVISENIKSELLKITQMPTSAHVDLLENLKSNIVRPISHQLAKEISNWAPSKKTTSHVTWKSMFYSLDPINHLPPIFLSTLLIALAAFPGAAAIFGVANAIQMFLIIFFSVSITTHIGFALMRKYLSHIKQPLLNLLVLLCFLTIAFPSSYLTSFVLRDTNNPFAYLVPGLFGIPLVGGLIVTGGAAWQRTREVTNELVNAKNQLRWAIARINLLNWYYNGILSRLLHGPIQNSIFLGLNRIRSSHASPRDVSRDVLNSIANSVELLNQSEQTFQEELRTLDELPGIWSSIASVEISTSSDFLQKMELDPPCTAIVIDVLQEICSNSIRHAGADSIKIYCSIEGDSVLITSNSNGEPFLKLGADLGIGLKFLSACSTKWSHSVEKGNNLLNIAIPTAMLKD
jgi:hypothetical protein